MRDDISDKLVHLTKGTSEDASQHRAEALRSLISILHDGALKGGTGFIKGKHPCVCFSEAPMGALSRILAIRDVATSRYKYQPYGVLVDKHWLFRRGGRPVIYGLDTDYETLPESMQYRHVRLDLNDTAHPIDFSWEREWRLRTERIEITPADVTVVVPDRAVKNEFMKRGFEKWHYLVLGDLGVKIDAL